MSRHFIACDGPASRPRTLVRANGLRAVPEGPGSPAGLEAAFAFGRLVDRRRCERSRKLSDLPSALRAVTGCSGRRWIAASVDTHGLSDQVITGIQWLLSYDDVDKLFEAAASRRCGEKIVGHSIIFGEEADVAFLVNWAHAGRRRPGRRQVRAAAGRLCANSAPRADDSLHRLQAAASPPQWQVCVLARSYLASWQALHVLHEVRGSSRCTAVRRQSATSFYVMLACVTDGYIPLEYGSQGVIECSSAPACRSA